MNIARECKTSKQNALVACACLLQKGGTSRNAAGTLSMKVPEGSVTLEIIWKHCRMARDTKVRQFAKGIKNEIITIMPYLGTKALDGNLAKTMKLKSYIDKTESIWCSDFQTYNQDCPEVVRVWLVRNYKNRFRRNWTRETLD